MFVPPRVGGMVICGPVLYVWDVAQSLHRHLAEFRGWESAVRPLELERPDEFARKFALVTRDADGDTLYATGQSRDVVVRVATKHGRTAVLWIPDNITAAQLPRDLPDLASTDERLIVVLNTAKGKPRQTQQEHWLQTCPGLACEVWHSDNAVAPPRVPVTGHTQSPVKYVRANPDDAGVRFLGLAVNTSGAVTEARLHDRFVMRRSV